MDQQELRVVWGETAHEAALGATAGLRYASKIKENSETEVVEAGMGLTRQIQRDWKTTRRSLASARPEEPNLVTP